MIGCHLSVSNGFAAAVGKARELGAECFQYFSKNPRAYRGSPADPNDGREGAKLARDLGVLPVAHAPYLINLAGDGNIRRLSIESFLQDLENCRRRETRYLVLHLGKPGDRGREEGLRLMRESLDEILSRDPGGVEILLENTAGQGSELGSRFEELLEVAEGFPPERVGFCLDTCHAFAAGYEIDRPAEVVPPEMLGRLRAVHLNDSKFPRGSHRDRHELLGRGEIGREGLRKFLAWEGVRDRPLLIETPVEHEDDYRFEIQIARELEGRQR